MVENVIWPAYLDANLSRREGRRVPLAVAIEEPTVEEIAKAAGQVGYDTVVEREKAYPREFDARGCVLVQNAEDAGKSDLIQAIAAYVAAMR